MLQKGAEYIKQLRTERAAVNEQMDGLRKEIEMLTNSLKWVMLACSDDQRNIEVDFFSL